MTERPNFIDPIRILDESIRGYEPDTLYADEIADEISDRPFEARSIFLPLTFGKREDGTMQRVSLFGGGLHGGHFLLQQTPEAWDIVTRTSDLSRLTVFKEGQLKNIPSHLPNEEVFDTYKELGLFEHLARKADVEDIRSAEPSIDILLQLANKYGREAMNDYIFLRMYRQWSQLPAEKRDHFVAYTIKAISHSEFWGARGKGALSNELGVASTIRRWNASHPELVVRGDLPIDQATVWRTVEETTHLPILQHYPSKGRSKIQKLAVDFNYYRDASFIQNVKGAVEVGRDVAICADNIHIRAIQRPLIKLRGEYLRQ